ncbi:nucleotide sugar dehydrogenase [Methanobacterium ferruginis]|uniref:nucleotide sugar dehydrogenase n=1 Tax=Methanobacterium ferruginis TaxID=710191 RepID=UPI002573BA67|nr:nucleotide sugar dehydrogenase [Methanobacterium ferruginis]BDZ69142.1 UDP-N-acetyl-D-glucosamine dehydrogenase [Methanobacterium ferruginis]
MKWKVNLISKIKDRSLVVGIIGLGYVGLPLAIAISKKFNVIGYDKNKDKIGVLKKGKSYIQDVWERDINLNKLHPTNTYEDLKKCDFIIITVPTPLMADKTPDLSQIKNSAEIIGKNLKKGQFIILKSTTYPGTTEEILIPILEDKSGLKSVNDFGVAYSPERVDPGNTKYKIENTPTVIGGLTPEFTEICALLYENITNRIIKVQDCKTAEAVKMMENIFRNVNIALVNELALIFERMEIDIWETIEAAKTKPYGFMAFYPGPGVGGHCVPLDPYYLSYRAKQYDIIPRFIETAGQINDYMPIHTLNLAKKGLGKIGKTMRKSNVLILGLAYKANISDSRESPAIKIIEELVEKNAIFRIYDPYVNSLQTKFGIFYSEKSLNKSLNWADCVIILTDHDEFKQNEKINEILSSDEKIIVDTRNVIKGFNDSNVHLYKL